MVTAVVVPTACVATAKIRVLVPAATVTLAGTVAAAVLLLDSVTTAPPEGAALLNVTVPVAAFPPTTDAGLTLTLDRLGAGAAPGVTVSVAERATSNDAVIVTDLVLDTANVVTVKVADVWPAGTMTIGGGVATDKLFVESVTETPPDGAGERSTTVPVAFAPPATLAGLSVTDDSNGGALGSGPT